MNTRSGADLLLRWRRCASDDRVKCAHDELICSRSSAIDLKNMHVCPVSWSTAPFTDMGHACVRALNYVQIIANFDAMRQCHLRMIYCSDGPCVFYRRANHRWFWCDEVRSTNDLLVLFSLGMVWWWWLVWMLRSGRRTPLFWIIIREVSRCQRVSFISFLLAGLHLETALCKGHMCYSYVQTTSLYIFSAPRKKKRAKRPSLGYNPSFC